MALPKFLQPIGSKVPAHSDRVPLDIAQAEAPRFEKVIWYKEPHLRKLYFLIIFLLIASATTGYDGMMVNTSQQMDKWKEYFPEEKNESKLGILINMYNIGSIVSFFIVPYLADNWGRKPTIMLGCVIMITGSFVSAFCNGYGMYMGGRFVLGFGNSLAQMSSPMLLTEICHPQHRGPLTAVYNCLWNLGSLIVSVVGWGTASINGHWSWRSITFIQAVPSIIQLCGIWWVPESPRFLINKDKSEEALQVLAKHHAGGDVNNATVQFQYREIKETIQADKSVTSTRYIDFFKTSGNRTLAILAIGNQTNKLAWNNMPNHWNFMLFYTLWDFCELIFVWYFYVETKGPTLEEIARIFDGDDAVAHIDLAQVEKETNLTRHESNTFEDYPPPKSLA
ncbi:hypothetical protein FOXG_19242 [Fusarium oxysporum f. sp. lycopersici 4287]|uniref:Major facilitator superfamily (MFS) profile domain-containing protein n=1 Tax=Fusarium oxysporum f. sp. lycopersici (strain 4287 / CBS 123668 / FGSC 9935 / NRRL 34936) TaxID=426428 RepID=A0A0J9UY70_FUSO4|nr:hypothetical protein FOXG_19242 [Fusarium oxysporum f. sp. lycopersici 4287]KNB04239.1 hypothetical protein FOXG_19242 [Fusarium oxysporum f. sp. lycopersici 4287]